MWVEERGCGSVGCRPIIAHERRFKRDASHLPCGSPRTVVNSATTSLPLQLWLEACHRYDVKITLRAGKPCSRISYPAVIAVSVRSCNPGNQGKDACSCMASWRTKSGKGTMAFPRWSPSVFPRPTEHRQIKFLAICEAQRCPEIFAVLSVCR